jgi:hypothetical protein
MLSVAGTLDLSRPGEHPFPPLESWKFTQHAPFKAVYDSKHRSVYLMIQRIQRHPFLALFDAPDANTSADVRTESTVPLQALFMMNNPLVAEQSRCLAERLMRQSQDLRERVRRGIKLLYARPAAEKEIDRALEFIRASTGALKEADAPRGRIELEAWTSYARVLLSSNEFLYVD